MARDYKYHPDVKSKPKEILGGNGRLIVKVSEEIAKQTSGRYGVKTNQIRRIFGDLKRRQYKEFDVNKIQLIRPKLAYTFSRHSGENGMDLLLGSLDFLIERVDTKDEYDNLVSLFESIVAYHKKHGGQ